MSGQRTAVLAPASILMISFFSCTTAIHPPASVIQPETVVLLTHGISSSLVLPDQQGRMVRWAYGDWRYYALGRDSVLEAIAALLWPTPAALGRRVVEGESEGPMAGLAEFGIAWDDAFSIRVERAAVTSLGQRLEALFAANLAGRVDNPEPNLEFVRHPEPYTLFNNSNRKIAQWLRELGCEVSGFPLLPRWRVAVDETQ